MSQSVFGGGTPDAVARPAATVIIVRERDDELEVLLLKRSAVGAFAGMWVFPGGRVDDADAGDDELSRARSAAVREAHEEVGLVVDPTALLTLSHWTPPAIAPKRFTTWFFVAPWTGAEPTIDDHEIVECRWMTPQAAFDEGLPMAPPTYVTLVAIAEASSIAGLAPLVERRGIERFVTVPSNLDGAMVLMWEPDAGYESGDPAAAGDRHRMVLREGQPPRYERTSR
jgi:8-oxo-dGTP pyrophosphatase MutT (NUDIX family)